MQSLVLLYLGLMLKQLNVDVMLMIHVADMMNQTQKSDVPTVIASSFLKSKVQSSALCHLADVEPDITSDWWI